MRTELSAPPPSLICMRILHTSDWHLGRTLHGVDLCGAHAAFIDHLVGLARESSVDAVVVSGDVFDRALPPLESVSLLDEALVRLTDVAPVVLIPGNHDSAQRLGLNAALLRDELHICSRIADIGRPVVLPDRHGHDGLLVYAIPYLDPDMSRDAVGLELGLPAGERLARSHEAVVGAALSLIRQDLARRRATSQLPALVMAHAFVTGGKASASERDLRIGGVDSVPAELFARCGADYVALGHLHGPQAVAGSTAPGTPGAVMRYAGSPLAFSFSEQHHHKSTAVVDIDAHGGVSRVELVPCPVPRRLSDVFGTIEEVLGPRFDAQHDDWVRAQVTGPARPEDLRRRVRQAFPHVLETRFVPDSPTHRAPLASAGRVDPVEVVAGFVTEVSGLAPSPAERAVLVDAVESAARQEAR